MRSSNKLSLVLLCATLSIAPASASNYPVHTQHGMVVTVHAIASQVGSDILQSGGNAVDAAVATGFALAVVHPPAGNIGGGGFMLVRMADGKTHFLDYREKAPAAATRDMYLDGQGNVIPGASEIGYKSIGVPGSVAGLVYAEQKYGKLTLKQVMAPAIKLARDGYTLTWEKPRISTIQGLRNFRSHAASSSVTATFTRSATPSVSPISPVRSNGLQNIPTTSITALSPANWRPPCRRAEALSPPKILQATK